MTNNDDKLEYFGIPNNIRHDHSSESLEKMREGIKRINEFFSSSGHDHCIEHLLIYAELNIRFFFLIHLLDKQLLKESFDLFVCNLTELFIKKLPDNSIEKAGN